MAYVYNGIMNNYVKKPRNLTEYTAYRGVTDWTQIGQFDQFETGYSFLSVISMPKFLERLASLDPNYAGPLVESFKHMLEYEFRGLEGIPNITSETVTITNGAQDVAMIKKVVQDSSIEVSMSYFEKSGGLITKFSEYFLTGIKDYRSTAKTYHGLIASGDMSPGYENEVFTLLYYVTDNTYLELERAFLLANAQITQVDMSVYNSNRGDIDNKELTISFTCFPITGNKVDRAAAAMLQKITGVEVTRANSGATTRKIAAGGSNGDNDTAVLDSANYGYQVLDDVYEAADISGTTQVTTNGVEYSSVSGE